MEGGVLLSRERIIKFGFLATRNKNQKNSETFS